MKALAYFRKATSLSPAPRFASGYLFCLHYMADYGPRRIWRSINDGTRCTRRPLRRALEKPSNDPSPNRRLRVGYVSSDLRRPSDQPVPAPLLRHRNRESFEVFCYSAVRSPDRITGQIRQETDQWRELHPFVSRTGADDSQGCNRHPRRSVDAYQRAAPGICVQARTVQVTYLAYCSTTGLETMDYRLVDPYLDPPGTDQDVFGADDSFAAHVLVL